MVTKGGWAERPHDIMWVPVWDTPHLADMERPPGGGWQEYQYGQMFASQSALHILLIKMCSTSYNICVYFSCQQLCSPSQKFTKKCELCGVKCCAGYALLFIKTKIGFLLWLGQGHRQDSHLHISTSSHADGDHGQVCWQGRSCSPVRGRREASDNSVRLVISGTWDSILVYLVLRCWNKLPCWAFCWPN